MGNGQHKEKGSMYPLERRLVRDRKPSTEVDETEAELGKDEGCTR